MARTPLEKAPEPPLGTGLIPKERYTSSAFAAREWDGMWSRVWLLAGLERDARHPGDHFTFAIGRESILVVRDRHRQLRAFYNVCPHRGNRLAPEGTSRSDHFVCRFHGWTFGLDGALRFAPDRDDFAQGLGPAQCALTSLPCDTWGGFIWVSLTPTPEPLRDYLGVIPAHLDPYHFEEHVLLNDITLEIDCNWKTCVDAFNEAYHVQSTHPELLEYSNDVDVQIDLYERHSRFLYRLAEVSPRLPRRTGIPERIREYFLRGVGIDPDGFTGGLAGVRPAMAHAMRTGVGPAAGIDFSDLTDAQLIDDFHYTIFPNVTLNIHARGVWVFRHRPDPVDPNRMFFDFWNMGRAPGMDLPRPPHEQHAAGTFALATIPGGEVLDQDVANLPGIQAGMRSRGYRGLFLGHQERRIRHFHETLLRYLGPAGDGA